MALLMTITGEYIDTTSMDCVTGNLNLKSPISNSPFYMVIETSGSHGQHDEEKLSAFLEELMNDEVVTDGTIASTHSQIKVKRYWYIETSHMRKESVQVKKKLTRNSYLLCIGTVGIARANSRGIVTRRILLQIRLVDSITTI